MCGYVPSGTKCVICGRSEDMFDAAYVRTKPTQHKGKRWPAKDIYAHKDCLYGKDRKRGMDGDSGENK